MMIEINLLPGARKSSKGGPGKFSVGASFGSIAEKIRDPWLVGSASTVVVAVAAVGILFSTQQARANELTHQIDRAVRDSTRLTNVLSARRKVTAERDSVHRQLQIIRTIDDNRYNWAHILDEVSQALPAYTWLTVLEQTTKEPLPPGADTTNGKSAPPPRVAAAAAKDKKEVVKPDTVDLHPELGFRIVGQTVDIQALTLFMKQLESSPFLQKVSLKRSEIVVVDGKDITEFELTATYEVPPSNAVHSAPLVVPVR